MIHCTVKLFAYFRDNRFSKKEYEYPLGTTVADIIDELKIERDEVGVVMNNSRHCQYDSTVQVDDVIAIFPKIGGG